MELVHQRVDFEHVFSVPSSGRFRGLCFLWQEEMQVSILPLSASHIDAHVGLPDGVI